MKRPTPLGFSAMSLLGQKRTNRPLPKSIFVCFGPKADIAAQLRVYEFAPCCRSVQHDVVKYHFLIAYLA
jgi:hypothetical protein